jgi:cytochrome c oxidase cbb3-type subunit 2
VADSIMPSYPFLFQVKDEADARREGEQPLNLPPAAGPMAGQVVVPRPEAVDLVKYLLALDHTYPVLPAPVRP